MIDKAPCGLVENDQRLALRNDPLSVRAKRIRNTSGSRHAAREANA